MITSHPRTRLTVLGAVLALVAGLLAVVQLAAAPAAHADTPYPTGSVTYGQVFNTVGDPKSYEAQTSGFDGCSDIGGNLVQPVESVALLAAPGQPGGVNGLGWTCGYPVGAPVAPALMTSTSHLLDSSMQGFSPVGNASCPVSAPVLTGLDVRLQPGSNATAPDGTAYYTGDSVADLRAVCGALGPDGRAYGTVVQDWVTRSSTYDSEQTLRCNPGGFVDNLQAIFDSAYPDVTDPHVFVPGIFCDQPTFDPALVAAAYPRASFVNPFPPVTLGSALGNDVITNLGCQAGLLVQGLEITPLAGEGSGPFPIGNLGVDCSPLTSPSAPTATSPAYATASWQPGPDGPIPTAPIRSTCNPGGAATGATADIAADGSVDALDLQCAAIAADGTPGAPETDDPGFANPQTALCPTGTWLVGLAVTASQSAYGTTIGTLTFGCGSLELAPPPFAANSSWSTATEIDPNSTTQQALAVPGEALWFKVPTTPGSTVSATLSNLPVDDDLSVFSDIGSAFVDLGNPPGQAAVAPTVTSLTRLSAEFAAVDVAPTTFSPTTFSPTTFSPTTFSPTTFSPTTFSPTTFSPTTFSPTTFSPTTLSPTTFSPTTFSPTTFSPATPLTSYIQSGLFSDVSQLADAFSAAQVRSLLAVSAHTGLTPETWSAPAWNRGGYTYFRVTGRNGVASPTPVTLTVTSTGGACPGTALNTFQGDTLLPQSATAAGTVVVTDTGRFGGADTSALQAANASLVTAAATTSSPLGAIGPVAVVDLAGSPRVQDLQRQAAANPTCPAAVNLAAQAIRDIVNQYRTASNGSLQYVTIEGSDSVVPFFRYADTAGVAPESGYFPPVTDASSSNASLRGDYTLGQDAYGAAYDLTVDGTPLPVPDLAVGRVVETPAEIAATVTAFVTGKGAAITPSSTLSTGYDFLAAGAQQVAASFAAANAATTAVAKPVNDTLITNQGVDRSVLTANGKPSPTTTWTASDLRTSLFGSHHDVVYLAGHFSANAALAADFTSTLTTRDLVAAAGSNFRNTLVFSAGCHSGYNLVDGDAVGGVTDPLDWAQAFAQAGATLVAGTGYQYGDTDFVKYSNLLYAGFADALRQGTGAVSVGSALVQAKRTYLANQATLDGVDQKSLLEATVFGLPMQGVNFRTGRLTPPAAPSPVSAAAVQTQPGLSFGLLSNSVDVPTPSGSVLTPRTKQLTSTAGGTVTATYYAGPNNAVDAAPGQPTVPVVAVNATPPANTVLRGVGFRSGTYTDTPGVTPLTGAPATETNTVHGPFQSDVFAPGRLATPNYFDALGGGGSTGATRLFVTPAQYRSDAPGSLTDVQRIYSDLGFVTYYSGVPGDTGPNQPATAAPPSVTGTTGSSSGSTVSFATHVVGDPSAGVHGVWVTWTVAPGATGGQGTWQSVDLVQDPTDSTLWTGQVTLPAGASASDVRFLVQAVNGVGVVGVDDALGAYHRLDVPTTPPAAAVLTMGSTPASVVVGGTLPLTATLTDSTGAPLANQPVLFTVGGGSAVGITNGSGVATANVPVPSTTGGLTAGASYAGSDGAGSAATTPVQVTVGPRPTTAAVTLVNGGYQVAVQDVSNPGSPVGVPVHTAYLVAANAAGAPVAVRPVPLDATGRGTVASSALPPGVSAVTAWFGSASTPVVPTTSTGPTTINQTDPLFGPATSASLALTPASITLAPTTQATSVTAGTALTYTVTATYPSGVTMSLASQAPPTITSATGAAVPGASCTNGSCSATTAGSYVITSSYLGQTASRTLTVTPGGLAVVTPSPAGATVTAGTLQPFSAVGTDRYGNPLPAGTTTWSIAPTSGGARCSGSSCGATAAGTYTVTATRGGVSGRTTLVVVAAVPATVTAAAGSNQSAATGAAFGTPLAAQVLDAYGNPVTGAPVTFTVPPSDATTGAATFPGGGRTVTVRTGANGVATAPALTAGSTAGPVVATAAVAGVAQPASYTLSVTAAGPARADLAVSAKVTATSATSVTVSVTVRNNGPSVAKPVGAALWIASGGTLASVGTGRKLSSQLVTFGQASLASGASTTFTVTVTRPSSSTTVLAVAGALSGVVDPQLGNNIALAFGR